MLLHLNQFYVIRITKRLQVGVSKARGDLFETDVDAADEVLEEKGFRIGSEACRKLLSA